MVKACPLVDQTRFKFVSVSYSGSVNFLLQYTPDAIVDWVHADPVNSTAVHSVGGMKSGTFRSRKVAVSRS